jgi:hypothetical protein
MNHRELKALADNADAVRAMAGYLLKLAERDPQVVWTDWEIDFLLHMAGHTGPEPLTTRQAEMLIELRDASRTYTSLDGIDVVTLVNECWLARFDLDEESEVFVSSLKAAGIRGLKRRAALRLLSCARELGLVERYVELAS